MKHSSYILLFLLLSCGASLKAQDIHFSQFYAFSHALNPAQVGGYEGDMRIEAIHRNQWRQIGNNPLTTTGIGIDKAYRYYSHEFHGGIMVTRDMFSGFNTISNKILLTGAYGINKFGSRWRVGVQTGLVTNSTNLEIQTFPNQWNYPKGEFDGNLASGEDNIRGSQMYWDLNLGLTWTKLIKKTKVSSGFALNHINRPKDTYFNQVAERRKMRGVFHTTVDIPLGEKFQFEPKLFWTWTTKANDFLLGSNFRYKTGLSTISSLHAGFFYRHGVKRNMDALYPVVGLSFKAFDFGFSYDVNISDLKTGIKRPSTFELSMIYTLSSSKVKYKIIPCDRY